MGESKKLSPGAAAALMRAIPNRPKEVKAAADKVTTKVEVTAGPPSDRKTETTKDEKEIINVKFFEDQPVRLWMDYSHTVNLGNYESAKISIGVSGPVGTELPKDLEEKIAQTYGRLSKILEDRMTVEVNGVRQFSEARAKKQAAPSVPF